MTRGGWLHADRQMVQLGQPWLSFRALQTGETPAEKSFKNPIERNNPRVWVAFWSAVATESGTYNPARTHSYEAA